MLFTECPFVSDIHIKNTNPKGNLNVKTLQAFTTNNNQLYTS